MDYAVRVAIREAEGPEGANRLREMASRLDDLRELLLDAATNAEFPMMNKARIEEVLQQVESMALDEAAKTDCDFGLRSKLSAGLQIICRLVEF